MVFRLAVRFIVSALVLLVMSTFLPGFQIAGFVNALIAAVAIAVLGYLAELLLGEKASPQSRGITGFIAAAVVIFLAQFLVPTMSVTVLGALLAAVVIGLVDAFVPTALR
jgi:putative membrane protein